MAKKSVPWDEVVLVSLLGGLLVLGLAVVGVWIYQWAWDAQAFGWMTGAEENVYGATAFGVGFVVTAVVLAMTTGKRSGSGIVSPGEKKRPGSERFEDRRWRRR